MPDEVPDIRTTPATLGRGRRAHAPRRWPHLLLLAPFVALIAVPVYAREEPSLLGFPFFYWYQLAWSLITIALMATVYRLTRAEGRGEATQASEPSRAC